ncbi:hypothetical protein GPECTOR_415g269 [Gonium pectorale]|uniref:DUF155 domain-containing protein n=1 Tax=Gonium pectorale TaxID=33097 RepID=A0A150FWE3_GONPE|nr:hypothetical protein GPECTOR_415g269 [Gonium pectorale]|eukprot:KXZ41525.1 hypothetical protein GPECTOR_415g269 [Gonium pectorale]
MKLAISYALAQSTKLSVYEKRVTDIVLETKNLPEALYTRVTEYLELESRVELLNSRFAVLQEMLDMLRDHQNNYHNVRLEWIVIWLIVVEVVVGLFELLGLFGLVGRDHTG